VHAARGIEAAQIRHRDVHQQHVGPEFFHQLDGLAPIVCFSDNFQRGLITKKSLDTFTKEGVIVADQNSDFATHAI